jgi:L-asparagine transporter-like permease
MVKKWIEVPVMIEILLIFAYIILWFYGAPKWVRMVVIVD